MATTEENKEILKYHKEQNESVHVVMNSKFYYNGKIKALLTNFFILNDIKGERSIPYSDVLTVSKYQPEGTRNEEALLE